MRFSETLTGPLLSTTEWLAQHRACRTEGDDPAVEVTAPPWFYVCCVCGSRHLCHAIEDRWVLDVVGVVIPYARVH